MTVKYERRLHQWEIEIDRLRALDAELVVALENLLRRYTKYLIDQGNHDKVILIATEEACAALAKAKGEK